MQQTSIIPLAQPASREAQTKTSIELLEFVNEARAEFGEAAIRHNDFLSRCKDELDGDLYETFVEPPRKTATGRIPAFEAITMTTKAVAFRIKQLSNSTTSVHPFVLVESFPCENPRDIERNIHAELGAYRVHGGREFFAISEFDAIAACKRITGGAA